MSTDDAVFEKAAIERRAFADLVETLTAEQLTTASLCAGWDVKMVAAHLAAALAPSKRVFVLALLRSAGNPHRANTRLAGAGAARPTAEVVSAIRAGAGSTFSPPGVGPRGPLTDALVHAGDIRLPLGLPYEPGKAAVNAALEFVTTGRPIGFVPRGLLRDISLQATDLDWKWGVGPLVEGRGIDLLMAACGRSATLKVLVGDGSEALAGRIIG